MITNNVQYSHRKKLSAWRKIAIGTWKWAGDPSVYGTLDLKVDKVIAYLKIQSEKAGQRITLTHFIGKAVAAVYKKHPELNCVLRFGSIYQRKEIDIFFQAVSNQGGEDLSGVIIKQIDKKSLADISKEMDDRVQYLRSRGDRDQYKIKNVFQFFPPFLMKFMMWLTGVITYKMNIWSPLLGAPRDPLGSVMITNIGALGLDHAFAPLVPYSHCPAVIAVGAVQDRPVVESGQVVVAPMLTLNVTFDHRLMDGYHASQMSKMIKEIFARPEVLDSFQ